MLKFLFKTALFLSLGVFALKAKAQDTCVFLFTIPQNAHFATADHLANTYLVHGFEVEKYDSTGRLVTRYSNNRLGTANFLDASNPLKILVWYADFQTAVFLDRNLTELGRLNVAEAGWPSVSSIAMASDGNLWIYDLASFKLMKITTAGEKLLESEPLNYMHRSEAGISFTKIQENGERVFVGFKGVGILSFDIFGQNAEVHLIYQLLSQFEIVGNYCLTLNQDNIDIQEIGTFNNKNVRFPNTITEGNLYWISKKRLFVQTQSGVAVYRF